MRSTIGSIDQLIESIEELLEGELMASGGNLSSFLRTRAQVPYFFLTAQGDKGIYYGMFFFKFEENKRGVHWEIKDGQYTFLKQETSFPALEIPSLMLPRFLERLKGEAEVTEFPNESLKPEEVMSGLHPVGLIIRKMKNGKSLGIIDKEGLVGEKGLVIGRLIGKMFDDGESVDSVGNVEAPTIAIGAAQSIAQGMPIGSAEVRSDEVSAPKTKAKKVKTAPDSVATTDVKTKSTRGTKALPTTKEAGEVLAVAAVDAVTKPKGKASDKGSGAPAKKTAKVKADRAKGEKIVKGAALPKLSKVIPTAEERAKALAGRVKLFAGVLSETEVKFLLDNECTMWPSPKEKFAKNITVYPNANPLNGPIVTWEDSKGRTQSGYAGAYREAADTAKFARVLTKVMPNLDRIEAHFDAEMKKSGRAGDVGTIGKIIYLTGLRPGRDDTESDVKGSETGAVVETFGISTLEARHVIIPRGEPNKVVLRFHGKHAVLNETEITDLAVVSVLKKKKRLLKPNDKLFDSTVSGAYLASLVNEQMNIVLDGIGSAKDLRTAKASRLAEEALNANLPATLSANKDEAKAQVATAWKAATIIASSQLNNTPAMVAKSYIAPQVLQEAIKSRGYEPADLLDWYEVVMHNIRLKMLSESIGCLAEADEMYGMDQPSDEIDAQYNPDSGFSEIPDGYGIPFWLDVLLSSEGILLTSEND